jgi:Carboxypeptidase regulatory-like domain/Prealbumin-like fold domain
VPVEHQMPTFTVTVRCEGKPVAGATVWPFGAGHADGQPPQFWPPVRTNAQGRVTWSVPTAAGPGVFGGRSGISWLLARDDRGRLGCLHLTFVDPALEPALRIELSEVGEATGKVLDTDGRPVAGAKVQLGEFHIPDEQFSSVFVAALPAALAEPYTTATGADGSFTIRNLPLKARLGATVSAPGYGTIDKVNWQQGQPFGLRLGRAAKAVIRPTGMDEAKQVAGLPLRLDRDQTRRPGALSLVVFRKATVGADGTATFEDLPPGTYHAVELTNWAGRYLPKATVTFEVADGATAEVEVPVEPTAEVRGRVVGKTTGAGVAGVSVLLREPFVRGRPNNLHHGAAVADAEGRFTAFVHPGAYLVEIPAPGPDYLPRRDPFGVPPRAAAGTTTKLPDVTLEPVVPLDGEVVDETGQRLAGVRVLAVHVGQFVSSVAATDVGGRFTLRNLGPDTRTALRARTATAVTDGAVVFDAATQKGPVRLVLSSKPAARLRGTVLDAVRKPVADAAVRVEWLVRSDERGQSGTRLETYRTDADGRFETQALWPGEQYRFHVSVGRAVQPPSPPVKSVAGQVVECKPIVLPKPPGA